MPDVVTKIIEVLACLTFLLAIPSLSSIGVNLLGCLIRWKECINLHSSVSLSRARNHAGWLLIPSFIVFCSEYAIYPSIEPFKDWPSIASTCAIFAAYLIARWLCNKILRGKKINTKEFNCAICCQRNFFIILVFIMTFTFLLSLIFTFAHETTSKIMLWEIIVVYAIHLIRKTQIFTYYVGFLAGFLYLCTLEILPTGLLIAPLLMR